MRWPDGTPAYEHQAAVRLHIAVHQNESERAPGRHQAARRATEESAQEHRIESQPGTGHCTRGSPPDPAGNGEDARQCSRVGAADCDVPPASQPASKRRRKAGEQAAATSCHKRPMKNAVHVYEEGTDAQRRKKPKGGPSEESSRSGEPAYQELQRSRTEPPKREAAPEARPPHEEEHPKRDTG